MKKYKIWTLVLILGFLTTGCAGISEKKEFAKGANIYSQQILPEYKEYIEKDQKLSSDSKKIRKQTADEFQRYIDKGIE